MLGSEWKKGSGGAWVSTLFNDARNQVQSHPQRRGNALEGLPLVVFGDLIRTQNLFCVHEMGHGVTLAVSTA